MTNPTVPNHTATVKTVAELYAAWNAAIHAHLQAYNAMVTDNRGPATTAAYRVALKAVFPTYRAWEQARADEQACDDELCRRHDLECDLEDPFSYEDPIPFSVTRAGEAYLDHYRTSSSVSDDLPF
ncbi:MAG: hypothetical protein NVSMB42_13990 [Herpetosiphon sp.]